MFVLVKGTHMVHIQTLLLVLGFVLVLAACISVPLNTGRYIMQVKTSVQGTYQFGPMGWCQIDTDQCSRMHTPYPISEVLRNATRYMKLGDEFSQRTSQLTLMLISATVAAIAAILSALSSTLRVLDFAFPMGILSMLIALVTLICEWTLFGTLRQRLEDNAAVNVTWGVAHWLLLASVITLSPVPFLGVFEYRRARRASKDRGIYAPLKNRKKVPYQF